jgi:ribonuclease HII
MSIAGVDEVGRGPLAGPVLACAVILNPRKPIKGLADSKKLSEKKREALCIEIKEKALCYAIGMSSVREIDEINILQASLLAMKRAVENLVLQPDEAWVDGNQIPLLGMKAKAIIGGDATVAAISAASIIAKVTRDKLMGYFHPRFPEYGFLQHKGYPTKAHIEAIRQYGVLPLHRKSFAPVRACLEMERV